MVGLLALGLVLVNVLGSGKPHVSKERAVAIARPHIDFKPEDHQIRFVRQGIPPRGEHVFQPLAVAQRLLVTPHIAPSAPARRGAGFGRG